MRRYPSVSSLKVHINVDRTYQYRHSESYGRAATRHSGRQLVPVNHMYCGSDQRSDSGR